MMEIENGPPSKRLKQGRLPFKPLDHSGQTIQGGTPPGSKKRKLSDNESPSAKQLRTSAQTQNIKCLSGNDCEHEVSSSSEAENLGENSHLKKANNSSTIDKFFKPMPNVSDQEEITSSNLIEIDLTSDGDSKTESEDKVKCVKIADCDDANLPDCTQTIKENIAPKFKDELVQETTRSKTVEDSAKSNTANTTTKIDFTEQESAITITDSKTGNDIAEAIVEENDDKTRESDAKGSAEVGAAKPCDAKDIDEKTSGDESFIESTSVCEDALKTPRKDSGLVSVLKTPVVGGMSSSTIVIGTPSQDSNSEGTTPLSGKKRAVKPLSESKRKERDAARQRVKDEKDRAKEERRLMKEKEKEDKKKEQEEKKKELAEKKRQKEEQKNEEKEKRERERLDKLKQKEDERKLKEKELEAKKEEKRKKEEERRLKEEERKQKEEEKHKEEEEKQRKAELKAEKFKVFFIKKDPCTSPPKAKETKNGMFMPFEVKPDMKLATPHRREPLSDVQKTLLDELMLKQDCGESFMKQLKRPGFVARKSGETWPQETEDDVEILSHEKEAIEKVTHRFKYLYFHENNRPPYYGTWRKRSQTLSPRNPFKQDEDLFDYEVDSDDEWEEEEPGESVSSDENDDDDDKPPAEDEEVDGDGWMVPHGYLSDGEGVEEEDEMDTASKEDLQRVRQAAWESELKRQAKPLRMQAIGCVWQDQQMSTIAAQQLHTLLKYKAVCLMSEPIGTSFTVRADNLDSTGTRQDKSDEKAGNNHKLRKCVPEEGMPDLIRLVHGNPIGIQKLMKEFLAYWKMKTNPDSIADNAANTTLDSSQLETSIAESDERTDKVDKDSSIADTSISKSCNDSKVESQDDMSISKRQLEIKIVAIATKEKRADCKRPCWYVKDEVLKEYNMMDIKLPNFWEYVCVKQPSWPQDKVATPKPEEPSSTAPKDVNTATSKLPTIKLFAQPMSPLQIQALGNVISNKETTASKTPQPMEVTVITEPAVDTPPKQVPSDQRSIMDMFSPARRVLANTSTNNPAIGVLPIPQPEQKDVPTSQAVDELPIIIPDLKDAPGTTNQLVVEKGKSTSTSDVKPSKTFIPGFVVKGHEKSSGSSKTAAIIIDNEAALSCKMDTSDPIVGMNNREVKSRPSNSAVENSSAKLASNCDVASATPPQSRRPSGHTIMRAMLTSPELMKTSPKQETSSSSQGFVMSTNSTEEPMEIAEPVIVLD